MPDMAVGKRRRIVRDTPDRAAGMLPDDVHAPLRIFLPAVDYRLYHPVGDFRCETGLHPAAPSSRIANVSGLLDLGVIDEPNRVGHRGARLSYRIDEPIGLRLVTAVADVEPDAAEPPRYADEAPVEIQLVGRAGRVIGIETQ